MEINTQAGVSGASEDSRPLKSWSRGPNAPRLPRQIMSTLLRLLLGLSLGCTGAGKNIPSRDRLPLLLFRGRGLSLVIGFGRTDWFLSLLPTPKALALYLCRGFNSNEAVESFVQ